MEKESNPKREYIPVETVFKEAEKQGLLIALSGQEKVKKLHKTKPSTHKAPAIKWDKQPKDYHGRKDPKYGTAIRCDYIESLKLYFVVIDLDMPKDKPPLDIPIEKLKTTCIQIIENTHCKQTPSGGVHIYLLSREKPEHKQPACNIDYQTNSGKNKGKYILSDYRWSLDGTKKERYNKIPQSHNNILVVDSTDRGLDDILSKLNVQGYTNIAKPTENDLFDAYHSPEMVARIGDWSHDLQDNEITNLCQLLKPLYIEGQRHFLTLYVSGWLYNAEISFKSALKVIKKLSENDEAQLSRITNLRNTYEEIGKKVLAGSSSVYDLIEAQQQALYPPLPRPETNDKKELEEWNKLEKERLKTIKNKSDKEWGKLARIIINTGSILGITRELKENGYYKMSALRELKRFIEERYKPILDTDTLEVYIYNNSEGYYEEFDEYKFLKFIADLFPYLNYFRENTNKVKSGISNLRGEDKNYVSFNNGLLNTDTLEMRKHTRKLFTKARVSYNYNEDAKGNLMETTLRDIFIDKTGDFKGEETKLLMFFQILGYCFTDGNPYQAIFFIHGKGGNGKSVVMSILKHIFGNYASSIPLDSFEENFGLEGVIGKKLNILYDLPRKTLYDVSKLKGLTGEDAMDIPRKHKPNWNGIPGLKIIGTGNHLPVVEDDSDGFWRRVSVIELLNTFKGDKRDIKRSRNLIEDVEGMEWLICKSINEYKKIEKDGKWAIPIGTEDMTSEYEKKSNPCLYVAKQLYEHTLNENDYVTRDEVIRDISTVLRDEGLEIPSNNRLFYDAVRQHMGGRDSKTHINNVQTRIIRMIKTRNRLTEDMKLKINNDITINAEDLNPVQSLIISNLTFKSATIKNLLEELEEQTSENPEQIQIEAEELFKKDILGIEEEK